MKKISKILAIALFSAAFVFDIGNLEANRTSTLSKVVPDTMYKTKTSPMEGREAPAFTLTNVKGDKVSLSDFKGKVVYMDIWASWCAPCLLEMKKSSGLKEYFSNNTKVVFLNVSIDAQADKWKQTIEKRAIKGINLISLGGKEEHIVENYQVPSIPRFILIDTKGKIVDFKAKRPSNKGLISDINKLL